MGENTLMKCPKCGKKLKTLTCAKCGHNLRSQVTAPVAVETPAAPVVPTVSAAPATPVTTTTGQRINYFTYNPSNPNVWYPVTVANNSQPVAPATTAVNETPVATVEEESALPMSKKEAKKAKKAAKKTAKSEKKSSKKSTDKETKKLAKAEKKAAKKSAGVTVEEAPVRKNVLSRLFALVLLAVCGATFAVLQFNVVSKMPNVEQMEFWKVVMSTIESKNTMFGVLPVFFQGKNGDLYNISIYVFTLCGVLAALHAFFAIFSKKKAPRRVRRSLFFLGAGAAFYAVALALLLGTGFKVGKLNMIAIAGYAFDLYALAIGAGCLVLSFLFLIFRRRNKNK